ncbi:polyamine transporter PotC [Actinomycetes bacterium]|nr:polyamine transporter PotC [Actinomycetes bacterium]
MVNSLMLISKRQLKRSLRNLAPGIFVGVVLTYLFAPVIVTVLFSFTTSPRLSLPIEGFTFEWYKSAFGNPLFVDAMRNTLILALVSAVVAVLFGTSFAFGITRLKGRQRHFALTTSLLPAAIPVLVLGISLAVFFSGIGSKQGIINAAIGHAVLSMPFVILTMNARLETFDFTTLEAARDLGASPLQTFRDITLPLIRTAVIGAGLLAIALSLDEFVVTWFNIGNEMTIPILIWGLLRRGIDPSINALASVVLVSLIIIVTVSNRLTNRTEK